MSLNELILREKIEKSTETSSIKPESTAIIRKSLRMLNDRANPVPCVPAYPAKEKRLGFALTGYRRRGCLRVVQRKVGRFLQPVLRQDRLACFGGIAITVFRVARAVFAGPRRVDTALLSMVPQFKIGL